MQLQDRMDGLDGPFEAVIMRPTAVLQLAGWQRAHKSLLPAVVAEEQGSWLHESYNPRHAKVSQSRKRKALTCGPRPKEARKARMSWNFHSTDLRLCQPCFLWCMAKCTIMCMSMLPFPSAAPAEPQSLQSEGRGRKPESPGPSGALHCHMPRRRSCM